MSFKDQLLKAGLVNKKQVRKANQKARKQRKKEQSTRDPKAVVEARERKQRAEEKAQQRAERIAERRARERAREAAEAIRRVDQILQSHRVHFRTGQQPFWHPSPDRTHAFRLDVPASIAFDLHCGKLAVAYRGPADDFEPDIVVVPQSAAERVQKIDPTRLLFFNAEGKPDDPAEALWSAD